MKLSKNHLILGALMVMMLIVNQEMKGLGIVANVMPRYLYDVRQKNVAEVVNHDS